MSGASSEHTDSHGTHHHEHRDAVCPAGFFVEDEERDEGEDDERHGFLNDLELWCGERPAEILVAYPIRWHLQAVLGESEQPRDENRQRECAECQHSRPRLVILEPLEMAVPREVHEDVAADEQGDAGERFG